MATLSFGNFPVDMTTEPQFLVDALAGEIDEDSVVISKTEISGVLLEIGTQFSITGKFVFTSEKAFLNSTVSGMEFLDGKGDLIMSLTGLPKLSFKKIVNLSEDEILNIFSTTSLTINGSPFNDHLIAETGNSILNGHGGDDILDGFTKNDVLNGGDGNDQLFGGGGKDTLNGGSGNDDLYGDAGNDTLTGGAGNDNFIFATVLGKNNVDTLTDFQNAGPVNTDEILLDQNIFSAIATGGGLAAEEFQSGVGKLASSTGSAHIVYNTANGNLYYDADASGSGKGVLFAKLTGSPDLLDNTDFTVT